MHGNETKRKIAARIAAGASLRDAATAESVPYRTAARWAREPGFEVEVKIAERARSRRAAREEPVEHIAARSAS